MLTTGNFTKNAVRDKLPMLKDPDEYLYLTEPYRVGSQRRLSLSALEGRGSASLRSGSPSPAT